MKTSNKIIEFKTKEQLEFRDITEEVIKFISESQIKDGLANIQSLHTSSAIIVNENEPLLIEDFKDSLNKIAPLDVTYRHDDLTKRTVNICPDECINGHSHCKAIYLSPSATLNLINGELQLGQWQRIFFVELDQSRNRKVQIQVIGS